jgi:23S rRNA pseudouridine2605 synthase
MEQIRLQKYLAEAGIASRRKCEEYIVQARVKVNNKIAELGTKINPEIDEVLFDNKKVEKKEDLVYILLNKPIGYVTTAKDQFSRDSVLDLVKVKQRVVPVGRLDMYTSGALLLSNDGDFVYKITHPKHEIDKTYTVTLKGIIQKEEVEQLEKGIKIEEYTTKPAMRVLL